MPVRIYALAKDLGFDSKELVDLCAKAGITGKGSALASLDDVEVQQVKAYLDQKKPPASTTPPPASPSAPVRTAPSAAPRVPAVIPPAPRKNPSPAREPAASTAATSNSPKLAPLPSAKAEEKVRQEEKVVPVAKSGAESSIPPTAPRVRPEDVRDPNRIQIKPIKAAPPPTKPPVRRPATGLGSFSRRDKEKEDGVPVANAPAAEPNKPPAIGRPNPPQQRPPEPQRPLEPQRNPLSAANRGNANRDLGSGGGGSGGGGGAGVGERNESRANRKSRQPVINLASLPDVKQPNLGPTATPSQKPDLRLSREIISRTMEGKTAPLERLVQQQQEQLKGGGGARSRSPSAPGSSGSPTRDKDKSNRRGRDGAFLDEEIGRKSLAGMASARADRGRGKKDKDDDIKITLKGIDEDRKSGQKWTLTRKGTNTAAPRKGRVSVELPCSVRQFSEAAGISAGQVLKTLMGMGMMLTINHQLDTNAAELVAAELNLDIDIRKPQSVEDSFITEIENREDRSEDLVTRPPIVTFLGHVDHGKTSLIDRIIGTRIVAGEAGGITQQIRSYQVERNGRRITFVDTPGHEAFTEMRARGANVTDIAVLVIAANDGIMPQTEEAISHIKAAGVPIVVALNKVDLPGVDLNRPLTQLTEHQLTPSEWGGDVEVVRTSALTGQGMDELLDTLLTVAELHEYTANPKRAALGVCLESQQLGDKGVVAKLVVKNGTLRLGDVMVCGSSYGRVRSMADPLTNEPIEEAPPSTPVNVTGLDEAPGAGDRFHVLDEISAAREIADIRAASNRNQSLAGSTTKVSFENFQKMVAEGKIGQPDTRARLNLIIRADTRGSIEAIAKELAKLDHPEVEVRILQKSVGAISLADVTLANASEAVILGFNVVPEESARSLADERGIEIRRYDVIYKMADDVKALVEGRLKPEERIVELGRALVKQTFNISRVGVIAGCYVIQGTVERGCRLRVTRDGRVVGDYPLETLRRIKDDVKEVQRGLECGIKVGGFNDVKKDDVLEAYRIEEVARKLE